MSILTELLAGLNGQQPIIIVINHGPEASAPVAVPLKGPVGSVTTPPTPTPLDGPAALTPVATRHPVARESVAALRSRLSPDARISEKRAATIFDLALATVRFWRYTNVGPSWTKSPRFGWVVNFRDFADFIDHHRPRRLHGARGIPRPRAARNPES